MGLPFRGDLLIIGGGLRQRGLVLQTGVAHVLRLPHLQFASFVVLHLAVVVRILLLVQHILVRRLHLFYFWVVLDLTENINIVSPQNEPADDPEQQRTAHCSNEDVLEVEVELVAFNVNASDDDVGCVNG